MSRQNKVIIVRHILTEADYAEARQYFSDSEIRVELINSGWAGLMDKVAACGRACKAAEGGL